MMKKERILLSLAMMVLLAGCSSGGGSSGTESNSQPATETAAETTKTPEPTPTPEPLDLTGLWVQEGKEETETHMSAMIRDDGTIGVFFIIEDEDMPYTYWVGTYKAPETDTKEYSWVSDNTYGGNGILSSGAENKEFSYRNEKISYNGSNMYRHI